MHSKFTMSKSRSKPRLKRVVFRCSLPECGRTSMGYYPKRASVAAKMSEYKYCSPKHQQKHWRQRTRYQRLAAKPLRSCQLCGKRIEPTLRPGRPRKYCSPAHATAAANKRRPPLSSEVAMLEEAVRTADEAVQEGWAALYKANEAAMEARLKADAQVDYIRSRVAKAEAALAEAARQAEADYKERHEAAKATLHQAEAALAQATREAEADHQERQDEAQTVLDQAQAVLTEALHVAMERLATEKRDLVEQLAALQEQGGFSLSRRRTQKRIERRLEEIEVQDIEESLGVETEAVQKAVDTLNAIEPSRSVEAEETAVERAKSALNAIEPPRSVEVEEAAVERAKSAHDQITASLVLFDRVVAALERFLPTNGTGTDEEKMRLREFLEVREEAKADTLANLEYLAWDAELKRAHAQERAKALSEKAERAVAILNKATKRLAQRAAAARHRRAMAAGVEPETTAPPNVQDVHKVDIERARRDPDYAAWLQRQGLL